MDIDNTDDVDEQDLSIIQKANEVYLFEEATIDYYFFIKQYSANTGYNIGNKLKSNQLIEFLKNYNNIDEVSSISDS